MRYSITIELDAATAEEAVALVAVGDIVELLNLDKEIVPLRIECCNIERISDCAWYADVHRQAVERSSGNIGRSGREDNLHE